MPNYVKNIITLTGSQSDISDIYEILKNKNTESDEKIDFNNVIPMPESMNIQTGTLDIWYVAVYLKSLSADARMNLAQELLKRSHGYYTSYYHKYVDSFTKEIPSETFIWMLQRFKQDFKSIKPESIEAVGKTYIDNILNFGADSWADWRCKNWGTERNAINSFLNRDCIEFQTAWSVALPITVKLSEMFPNVTFCHEWSEEFFGDNYGRYKIKNGKAIEGFFPDGKELFLYDCSIWWLNLKEFEVGHDNYKDGDIDDIIQKAIDESVKDNANKSEMSSIEM